MFLSSVILEPSPSASIIDANILAVVTTLDELCGAPSMVVDLPKRTLLPSPKDVSSFQKVNTSSLAAKNGIGGFGN